MLSRMRSSRLCTAIALAVSAQACATGQTPTYSTVGTAISDRSGINAASLTAPKAWTAPEGVAIDDGLTPDEAVAIAMWNNPDFHVALTELGIARADLMTAGMIRNPVLSLLFPWGPKQFEMTLNWPIDTFWQRPKRIADATFNAEAVAQTLVAHGLRLVAEVRAVFADVVAAERALTMAAEQSQVARQLADINAARLRAGDISEFESRLSATDAIRIDAAQLARRASRDLAMVQLRALLGLAADAPALTLTTTGATPASCGDLAALMKTALASRPEVRAAELQVEAAGARAGLEEGRIVTLTAILDANGEGRQGFEMGPGLAVELPILSQNQGGRARAAAELDRAGRRYLAARASVGAGVESAYAAFTAARDARRVFDAGGDPSLARDRQQAQRLYDAGEISLLNLLETRQRLNAFEQSRLDADAAVARAQIRLDEAVGRVCREPVRAPVLPGVPK
jgi:cobalt-zinc-cadmium efflux system outer membrane protein